MRKVPSHGYLPSPLIRMAIIYTKEHLGMAYACDMVGIHFTYLTPVNAEPHSQYIMHLISHVVVFPLAVS